MLSSELDYDLPRHFIAQSPAEPRDSARLLRFRAAQGEISHQTVRDLPTILRPNDVLVFNDTRVLKARLFGQKPTGGRVEALLLKELGRNCWEAMLRPSARLREGGEVIFQSEDGAQKVPARLEKRRDDTWEIAFQTPDGRDVRAWLDQMGHVPLPPYIAADETLPERYFERYQTVFARENAVSPSGHALDSAAAPTAGLHFTPELLEKLRAMGVQIEFVTLAVGAGTFAPVSTPTLDAHKMHLEEYEISEEVAARLNVAREHGKRVVAVGTTAVRTLESAADEGGKIAAGWGQTRLFLKPGAHFRAVDALLTNFHLPRSTLLALVAAFIEEKIRRSGAPWPQNGENGSKIGLQEVHRTYREAMNQGYRFFSFGDAMFIE